MAKLTRTLAIPRGYNVKTQRRVASFASQLDDQLTRLKERCAGMTVEQLEWQPRTGINTVGMLIAHLAVVDVFWLITAVREPKTEEEINQLGLKYGGILPDDDGLPLKSDGKHPMTLAGWTLEKYFKIMDRARKAVHKELRTWNDRDLAKTFKRGKRTISREWALYHVLEHFAGHFGQILLVQHLMRDAGVLPPKE